jgi:DNA-binding transcriptional MerR regulator
MINGKKTYYSISEVCSLTGLEPHVLRYWETEFSQLRPKKNRAGNRAYREKDIEVVKYIKQLLYEEQFTIPGAKKRLAEPRATAAEPSSTATVFSEIQSAPIPSQEQATSLPGNGQFKEALKKELAEVLELLKK